MRRRLGTLPEVAFESTSGFFSGDGDGDESNIAAVDFLPAPPERFTGLSSSPDLTGVVAAFLLRLAPPTA